MAQADRETTTPAATASWEIVCLHLYNEQEKKELLGYPPFTQRTMDEMFLLRAILGRLFLTQDDYDDLRRRLRSNGFSENLVALKVLPVTIPNLVEAQRRMKRACQDIHYEDEQDEGEDDPNTTTTTTTTIHNNNHSNNNKRKKRINVPLVDIYRMGDYCIRDRERRKVNPPEYSSVFCNNFFPPELVERTGIPQCGDTTIPASHSESYQSLFEPSSIAMVVNLPSMVQPTFLEENHPTMHPCTTTTTSAMMESPFLGSISTCSDEDASGILSRAVHDEADPPMDNAIHDMCHSLEPSQKKIKLG